MSQRQVHMKRVTDTLGRCLSPNITHCPLSKDRLTFRRSNISYLQGRVSISCTREMRLQILAISEKKKKHGQKNAQQQRVCFSMYGSRQKKRKDRKILYVRLVNTHAEHNEVQRSAAHWHVIYHLPFEGADVLFHKALPALLSLWIHQRILSKYRGRREESHSWIGTLNVRHAFCPLNPPFSSPFAC